MGSPLAPLVSEIFMNLFENNIFNSDYNLTLYIEYWYKYVDDILCLWSGSLTQLNDFLAILNSQFPSIKFTIEVGGTNINFLDLSIYISEGKHHFNIYRKPTHTDITIQGDSYCPLAHKHAAYHTMIHRLISVPLSPEDFQREVDIIKYLAQVNHVDINIDSILSLIHI